MQSYLPDSVQTVSQLTASIRFLLEEEYRFITVSGEISNLRTPYSGHHYFTLKDENAQLRAVLFKSQQRYLDFSLQDGQQVVCRGRISVYEPRGEYQLIVDTVDQYGRGNLQIQFAELKKRLFEEGLFDSAVKKKLPPYPEKIVVISSPTGAAVHDFLKICRQRKTNAHIQVFPVPVQGEAAPGEIARAIQRVNRTVDCDLIALCRGGGSLEDLWAFNSESVARAIYDSEIPIVTGIGHEIDYTIADFCADVRTPTPTGAAEMVIPDNLYLAQLLQRMRSSLIRSMGQQLARVDVTLTNQLRLLGAFGGKLEKHSLRLDLVIEKLQLSLQNSMARRNQRYREIVQRLESQAPLNRIKLKTQQVDHLTDRLTRQIHAFLDRQEEKLGKRAALLNSISPLATLARGYAIVRKKDTQTRAGQVVSDSHNVQSGDTVDVLLHKGRLLCEVIDSES